MALDEEILQSYVDRLLALQAERADSLTADELREVAYDLGLTDADLEAAAEAAEKGLQRGLGFLQHGRLDDAVKELEAAAALAPERTDILHATAQAYRDRFRASRRPEDRAAAARFARRCLDLDPGHDESYRLLNDLDGGTTAAAKMVYPPRDSFRRLLLPLAVVGLLAFGFMFFLSGRRAAPPPEPPREVVPAPPPVAPVPSTVTTAPDVPAVPVEFKLPDGAKGLALKARSSTLDYYSDEGYYKLEGEVRNSGPLEYHELKAFIEVLDDAGTVIASDTSTILSRHEADLRPGDVWVYDSLTRVTKPATKARVTIQDYDADPAAASYAKPKPVVVRWMFEQPADLKVAVSERSSARTGGKYFAAEFAIHNPGPRPIRLMKFQMIYLDNAGQQLATRDFYLTITSQPSLPVGETWARATINEVPESFGGYELRVIEAQ